MLNVSSIGQASVANLIMDVGVTPVRPAAPRRSFAESDPPAGADASARSARQPAPRPADEPAVPADRGQTAGQAAPKSAPARDSTADRRTATTTLKALPRSGKDQVRTRQPSADGQSAAGLMQAAAAATLPAQAQAPFARLMERLSQPQARSAATATRPAAPTAQPGAAEAAAKAKAPATVPRNPVAAAVQGRPTGAAPAQAAQPKSADGAKATNADASAARGQAAKDARPRAETREPAASGRSASDASAGAAAKAAAAQTPAATQAVAAARQAQAAQDVQDVRLRAGPAEGGKAAPAAKSGQVKKTSLNAPASGRSAETAEARTEVADRGSPAGGQAGGRPFFAGPDGQSAVSGAVGAPGATEAASSASSAPAAGGAAKATLAEAARQAGETPVPDQIAQAVRASGARLDRQITVRLSPPELGTVRVTLRQSGDQVRGVLTADNPETQRRLERESPALVQRLQEAGVQVRRIDVAPARQDGDGASGDPTARDGGHGRMDDRPGSPHAAPGRYAPPDAAGEEAAPDPEPVGVAGPGLINVRI